MSCDTSVDLSVNIHTAAIVREALFQYTKQDSYEFPGQRTIAIRSMILSLDEAIKANLPKEHDHEGL
jgi:hypothetical protein